MSSPIRLVDARDRALAGRPTYSLLGTGEANTAAAHALVVEGLLSALVFLHGLWITQPGLQTTAGLRVLQVLRTTSAGTGGAVTPAPLDPSDPAYGGICRKLPGTPGAESTVLWEYPLWVPAALGPFTPVYIDFARVNMGKPFVVPAGVANGIALKDPGAAGGASLSVAFLFST